MTNVYELFERTSNGTFCKQETESEPKGQPVASTKREKGFPSISYWNGYGALLLRISVSLYADTTQNTRSTNNGPVVESDIAARKRGFEGGKSRWLSTLPAPADCTDHQYTFKTR